MRFMNSDTTYTTFTSNSGETEALAQSLSGQLKGGALIELVGDLGAGKTTFVHGLARGLGYDGPITSPTFTVARRYQLQDGRFLNHVDLYRVQADPMSEEALHEAVKKQDEIVVVEWAGLGGRPLPERRITVELRPDPSRDENARLITVRAHQEFAYALQGLQHVAFD